MQAIRSSIHRPTNSSLLLAGRATAARVAVGTTTKTRSIATQKRRILSNHNISLASSSFQTNHHSFSTLAESYNNILVSKHENKLKFQDDGTLSPTKDGYLDVGLITLHRPKALNALSDDLFDDLIHAANAFNSMEDVGSIVITGKGKAFAAGADISEMSTKDYSYAYQTNMFAQWADIMKISKPVIAAVNGFALGGGCELAMMCDIIIAAENAKFGQPEINLGIIPGAGGSQRLVRAIGKSKAMEMILTGNMIDAHQAERDGLISKVVSREDIVQEAIQMGFVIGSKGSMAVQMAKEAVNASYCMTLDEGLKFERRLFHSLFATKDQKEGMSAFLSKRDAEFKHS